MALVKATLVTAIKNLITSLLTYDGSSGKTQAQAIDKYASDLADAIDTYIKTATVTSTVTGTATVTTAPGVAPVTGSGTGTIS